MLLISQVVLFLLTSICRRDIHILSLSTFKSYPDVVCPKIHIPVGQESSVEIDIHGSRFVASTHIRFTFRYENSIRVYNWRTGRMLAVSISARHSFVCML